MDSDRERSPSGFPSVWLSGVAGPVVLRPEAIVTIHQDNGLYFWNPRTGAQMQSMPCASPWKRTRGATHGAMTGDGPDRADWGEAHGVVVPGRPALRGSKAGRLLLASSEKKEGPDGPVASMCVISLTIKSYVPRRARLGSADARYSRCAGNVSPALYAAPPDN